VGSARKSILLSEFSHGGREVKVNSSDRKRVGNRIKLGKEKRCRSKYLKLGEAKGIRGSGERGLKLFAN